MAELVVCGIVWTSSVILPERALTTLGSRHFTGTLHLGDSINILQCGITHGWSAQTQVGPTKPTIRWSLGRRNEITRTNERYSGLRGELSVSMGTTTHRLRFRRLHSRPSRWTCPGPAMTASNSSGNLGSSGLGKPSARTHWSRPLLIRVEDLCLLTRSYGRYCRLIRIYIKTHLNSLPRY